MKNGGGMTWTAGHLRPRAESDLRHDRQSAAGDRARESCRRQSLHRLDRGAQRRHREDGLVFPVLAARHPRLGLDADGRRLRRRLSTASRASSSRRPRATGTSSCSTGRTARRSCRPSSSRRTGRWATTRRASRFRIRPRCRRSTARSCRRTRVARPTGNRRPSARRPGCSTSTRRAPSACTTSTIRATTRRAGAAPTAADGRSRCCRRSTIRPARSAGRHPWQSGAPSGLLSTAGNVVFTSGSGGLEALDARTGEPLWHSRIGPITNAPITLRAGRPSVRRRRLGRQRLFVCDELTRGLGGLKPGTVRRRSPPPTNVF